ncbi:MAG: hypothetical protein OEM52_06390 [bacterium]|nr:hypothetical protein [bacterium]
MSNRKHPSKQDIEKDVEQTSEHGSRSRFFMLRMVTFTILLLVVGWWGYSQVMHYIYGQFSLSLWSSSNNAASVPQGWSGMPQALLVHPLRTERYLHLVKDDTTEWPYTGRNDLWPLVDTLWYAKGVKRREGRSTVEAWQEIQAGDKTPSMLEYWKETLFNRDIKYKIIEEPDLTRNWTGYEVLILPGTLLLSMDERDGIKRFLANGGNVLMCWSVGCRDETGNWVGFDFLEQVLGSITTEEVRDSAGGTSMVLHGGSPITAMITPGSHLEFFTYNGSVTMNPVETTRVESDATWFKPYWREKVDTDWGAGSMIMHGRYLRGKFVWYSFTPDIVQDNKDNSDLFDQILHNSIAWLHGQPLINVQVWPKGYQAGGAMLLEGRSATADYQQTLELARSSGAHVDLMLDADFQPPGMNRGSYGGVDIVIDAGPGMSFAGHSLSDQTNSVSYKVKRIEQMTGKPPVGLFTSDWNYDALTLEAAARHKLKFVFGNPSPRYYGPASTIVNAGGWWSIFSRKAPIATFPKYVLTMREWYEYRDMKNGYDLSKAMNSDLRRVANAGGLYLGIIDPALDGNNVKEVIPRLVSQMDSMGVWRSSISTVIDRFAGWQNIRVSAKIVSRSRIRISVTNSGKIPLRDIYVEVYLSNDFSTVNATAEVLGNHPQNISWDRAHGVCGFTIPDLGNGDNITISLDVTTGGPAVTVEQPTVSQ